MNFSEIFGNAKWIGTEEKDISPIIRSSFMLSSVPADAKINIIGFGNYRLYINGKRVSEDYYLPLYSDFHSRGDYPVGERLAHRIYADSFDISHLLKEGKNSLAVILADGWYTRSGSPWEKNYPRYGNKKLAFRIFDGLGDILLSDTSAKYAESYIKSITFFESETQDFSAFNDDALLTDYDDSEWKSTVEELTPSTEYYLSDCQRDRVTKKYTPRKLGERDGTIIYDAGENISGFPVFKSAVAGETVRTEFSEELTPDGALDPEHHYKQIFTFTADKAGRIIAPEFIWYGFRYFSVTGDAEVVSVYKVHTDVRTASAFECDNEILNWTYNTFLNTQLCNMHSGVPSDCPHIERKGYTGDGQLCARATMLTLDTKEFYKKWIGDISDCQDRVSGHVQYTAPYTKNGGGPGGWGIAIVNTPLDYYERYGDISEAERLYPQMLRFFDYLEAHSEGGLVTSDIPGAWCLGEWCTPGPVVLPAPFVNNYFYIKGLMRVISLARLIGKEDDIPTLERRLAERKAVTAAAYFNTWDGNFLGNLQGANAFALDIGLGNERTKKNFINYYKNHPYFDTGIFGSEIIIRLLFEYGEADTAFKILSSEEPRHSYGYWKNTGATTFREEWGKARSHSHPMFGAPVAHFFSCILGISQRAGTVGYNDIIIKPAIIEKLTRASGFIENADGKIEVSYEKRDGELILTVSVPRGTSASVILPDGEEKRAEGALTVKYRI